MRTMHAHSSLTRVLWFMAAVLQLALPTAATWADVREDVVEAGPRAIHFESHTSSTCPHAHGPDCIFCRFITTSVVGAAPVVAGFEERSTIAHAFRTVASGYQARVQLLHFSRGPPVLS
ncbi:MAG TPA: hypothetical protein VLV45_15325 [Gemmatimonadales bacterium]|nr:hypothetical protein [Gemmatimonadales bacterium]